MLYLYRIYRIEKHGCEKKEKINVVLARLDGILLLSSLHELINMPSIMKVKTESITEINTEIMENGMNCKIDILMQAETRKTIMKDKKQYRND